ncbi:MAG TPA: hypothetical protein VLQ45_14105 [Thermoanaerobaculia bacterium]|nr:hypothetical protein [Thermoanaerobaculia bacterium]
MSPSSAFSLAVVCEAAGDLRICADLADRVLTEEIDWIDPDNLHMYRSWRGLEETDSHLEWHWVSRLAKQKGLKPHGHFRDEPGDLDARMARKALLLLLKESTRVPDAVLLIRDSDGLTERRRGLEQARDSSPWAFPVVLGVAHTKRECWVLAGFEAQTEAEEKVLAELRRELGFDPRLNAEDLSAAEAGALRNAKRVLERLLQGSPDRERICWMECEVETLRERGRLSGLSEYLDEVRARLVPLFSGRPLQT